MFLRLEHATCLHVHGVAAAIRILAQQRILRDHHSLCIEGLG